MNWKRYNLIVIFLLCAFVSDAQSERWKIKDNGEKIVWNPSENLPHSDHIEMSGKRVSAVIRYKVDGDTSFSFNKSLVFPMLRTIPNNTHASLMRHNGYNLVENITINGKTPIKGKTVEVSHSGVMEVEQKFNMGYYGSYIIKSAIYPSVENAALLEDYVIINTGNKPMKVEVPYLNSTIQTPKEDGVEGVYKIVTNIKRSGNYIVNPNDSIILNLSVSAYKNSESIKDFDFGTEKLQREQLVDELTQSLILETPASEINTMFAFSKIRACESIFQTKGGPMHAPGGESYYAAIWANDQAEYINPFFPFVGYEYGNASALNSYEHFARFMNDKMEPIPSSIIAEGIDIWNGAGDRGDAAMIAYGAARYALARGDKKEAEQLWPLITWCLEFCKNKINEGGVVASDSDELEGRFPAGDANLCTSSLYYDALISSAYLAKELGKSNSSSYLKQAKELRTNIEKYFGANVEGFDTYAYYKGNDILRSWICIPLTVGIDERAKGTSDALFSPRLWTNDGLLTQAGSETFWDRSTLYALRGVYTAGQKEKATDFLTKYSKTRLLGEHVPYAIEAWPEGNQRHLSAESALYARIITEGLFGIRPTGLNSFEIAANLPQQWDNMALRRIKAFGNDFDIEVKRVNDGEVNVKIISNGGTILEKTTKEGHKIKCKL